MPTTITVPDFWILFDADGVAQASMYGVFSAGDVFATADQAWKHIAGDTKKERDKHERAGWYVAPISKEEWESYFLEGRLHVR
ncbi:hypothetical protein ACFVAJ_16925 [Agromyces sp. NPDC057679]|uniref:hypothetical protein n=1 Tax=Agromyces sp. NPDC057679 TaxID=3346207 RepID=UPI003670437F